MTSRGIFEVGISIGDLTDYHGSGTFSLKKIFNDKSTSTDDSKQMNRV